MNETLVGAILGGLGALVVVTLLNFNCDSLLEQIEGCERFDAKKAMIWGAIAGAVFTYIWDRRPRGGDD